MRYLIEEYLYDLDGTAKKVSTTIDTDTEISEVEAQQILEEEFVENKKTQSVGFDVLITPLEEVVPA